MRRYPWRYWLAVAMVGIFGTMAADVLHVGLGVPYASRRSSTPWSSPLCSAPGTLSRTRSRSTPSTARREVFYWAAVLSTFALGTAIGDLTAITFALGYFGSALLFAALIALLAIGYFRFGSTRSWPSGPPTCSPGRSAPRSPTGWRSPRPAAASGSAPARSASCWRR